MGITALNLGSAMVCWGYNAQVVRKADGCSAQDARALGVEINIADGKGTVYDQAKFLRDTSNKKKYPTVPPHKQGTTRSCSATML